MNVVFVSHCDFTGNSALHVLALAREAAAGGASPVICVPHDAKTIEDVGRPSFPVVSYEQAEVGAVRFPDGRPPTLIHAFTPRELVRDLTESLARAHGCPYIVHLEDNEWAIVRNELNGAPVGELSLLPAPVLDLAIKRWRSHPIRAKAFLKSASGMTAVIDRLMDFWPTELQGVVFWPGFDEALLSVQVNAAESRDAFGIGPHDILIVYNGNVHRSNLAEVRSLYLAIALLNRAGYPVRLIKTGWNQVDMSWVDDVGIGRAVNDLGFVPRHRVLELLMVADVLIQPGRQDDFNDYRFPSKLPEFLASGRPVILPRTNIGRYLNDRKEALLLGRGDAGEIAEFVRELIGSADLRRRIGEGGRAFALRELRWAKNVEPVLELYERVASEARQTIQPAGRLRDEPAETVPPVKLIAFYLPQFHRIPENDEWWGEGFTEWANVTNARPQFRGHFQPQLPSDLGMYELSDPSVMEAQAAFAREYGIYGFCFYYYWFNGRRVLERPVDEMLASGRPKMPFCLCWANENWTRRWDGLENEVLLRQEYEGEWWERFIADVIPAIGDERYIRVEGAPLLLVYRPGVVPGMRHVVERWRDVVRDRLDLDLHLAAVQSFGLENPTELGFDAAVEFPPHTVHIPADRRLVPRLSPDFSGFIEDYRTVMATQLAKPIPHYRWYRGVMPSWDNTARRGSQAHIVAGSSPADYRRWLRKLVLQALIRAPVQEPLVFVNAWNEWAEGTHLEPDQRYGRAWLEATRAAAQDGLRQFCASLGYDLSPDQADAYLQLA